MRSRFAGRGGRAVVAAAAALALGGLIAAVASPASGAGAAFSFACNPAFSPMQAFAASSAARGDEGREPELNQVAEEVPASARGRGGRGFSATIPVYFHVVTPDGVTGNVSLQAIRDQIQVLNLTFGGFEGGADTGFTFKLAGVDRTVNAEWYSAGPTTKAERDMKKALRQGGSTALNYYSTTAGPYLGWAYFPNVLENATAYLDGIVVDWESMPGTSARYADRYDLGKTATHEVGHWLNLHHTFNGGCNNWGDYVADTPAQSIATYGCPEGQDSCSEPGLDPIHNYMDYSFDSCYDQFTSGQAARMQDAWLYWRA